MAHKITSIIAYLSQSTSCLIQTTTILYHVFHRTKPPHKSCGPRWPRHNVPYCTPSVNAYYHPTERTCHRRRHVPMMSFLTRGYRQYGQSPCKHPHLWRGLTPHSLFQPDDYSVVFDDYGVLSIMLLFFFFLSPSYRPTEPIICRSTRSATPRNHLSARD